MSSMSIYGLLIMVVNNYQVYLTGCSLNHILEFDFIWTLLFTVTIGLFQQFVLEKR